MDATSHHICEICGEPATPDNPVEEFICSPPVDGYRVEVAWAHNSCAAEAARSMVE